MIVAGVNAVIVTGDVLGSLAPSESRNESESFLFPRRAFDSAAQSDIGCNLS
jgi:hypothetical protein